MRRIHVLKAIVDFLWIISMPAILIIVALCFAIFLVDLDGLNLKINAVFFNENNLLSKVLLFISALNYLLIIAALYFFRKALSCFLRVKIFEEIVIKAFKKTGNLLIISGIISLVISMISTLYFKQKIGIELGLNEHIIIICLGLFFQILSEIFRIAKNAKQENDLTI
jgi:hypothetical protein